MRISPRLTELISLVRPGGSVGTPKPRDGSDMSSDCGEVTPSRFFFPSHIMLNSGE